MLLSIIVIGDELLIGQIADTNSGWIARHMNPLGWKVNSVRTVADDADQIKKAINDAFAESDLVLTTGGLGPTKDDITKQTMLELFGGTMVHDVATEKNVLEVVEKRHLKINPLTAHQADIPSSCRVIQNKVGTAPIMWFEKDSKVLVSMPGVPFETEIMMEKEIIPQIKAHFNPEEEIQHRTFVVIDYSESVLAMKLEKFEEGIPPFIKLAYLPRPGIIRLRLTGISKNINLLNSEMDRLSNELKDIIGKDIVSYEDCPLEEILGNVLREKKLTLSTAESCTGGNIAHMITEIAGSSDYFKGSVVSYSNEVKMKVLGVPVDILDSVGAVSEETVKCMANGVSQLMNTDCAIATSGIAGPTGAVEGKPVGTVWMAIKTTKGTFAQLLHLPGNRERVIDRASMEAIKFLLKSIR